MSGRVSAFIGGVVAGIFIDQTYHIPNVSKVGTNLGKALWGKVNDLEKKDENERSKNKNEKSSFWWRK